MTQPLLSILIPYTPERVSDVKKLVGGIIKKNDDFFEIVKLYDELKTESGAVSIFYSTGLEIVLLFNRKEKTIGEIREILYSKATGVYSWQIDSDDDIADNAIELILKAIKENPGVDCITFNERCMMNGVYKSSNHSLKYKQWQDNFDGFDYVRCPFYKDVIRTDIAQSVPFEKIRWNEDERWSMALRQHLKTEHHIDEELYYYIYEPKETHEERYGLNQ